MFPMMVFVVFIIGFIVFVVHLTCILMSSEILLSAFFSHLGSLISSAGHGKLFLISLCGLRETALCRVVSTVPSFDDVFSHSVSDTPEVIRSNIEVLLLHFEFLPPAAFSSFDSFSRRISGPRVWEEARVVKKVHLLSSEVHRVATALKVVEEV